MGINAVLDKEISDKVLVVDDDPDFLSNVSYALKNAGFEIVEARQGLEAVDKYGEYKPKVVVLDIMLPKRSGLMVLEGMHKKSIDELPYVIMVTALDGRRHEMYAKSLFANEYLRKPIEMEKLVGLVDTYFKK